MVIHQSVLVPEVLENLYPKPGEIVVDGTLGLGGHAECFVNAIQPNGRLVGFDFDKEAVALAQERLKNYMKESGQQLRALDLFTDNFANISAIMKRLDLTGADIIFLDLGVSSYQLEKPERGFSFMADDPLDMRMSLDNPLNAKRIVNEYSQSELERIIEAYGEEKFSRRIARYIVEAREKEPITTTGQLVAVVKKALPGAWQRTHPATRLFQALRIEVNRELDNLKSFLEAVPSLLNPNGRLGIISFHSLEDRLVKQYFKDWHWKNVMRLRTRKPILPSRDEVRSNPRSRSAKLRVVTKP